MRIVNSCVVYLIAVSEIITDTSCYISIHHPYINWHLLAFSL